MLRTFGLTALLLAGCATTPATPTGVSAPVLAQAKAAIVDALRDPDSAQFRDATAYSLANGETAICIMLNARNGFGGMTGFKPALVNIAPTGAILTWMDDPAAYECASLSSGMSNRL